MVKKVQMYAKRSPRAMTPPPQQSSVGVITPPPTALSKVGKYALGNEGTRVACKSVRSASLDLHGTRVL